jgi:hypothetical protein
MQVIKYYCAICDGFIRQEMDAFREDLGGATDNRDYLCAECSYPTSSDKA